LYLHNVELGEKRATAYLTLVSIGTAVLVGLAQVRSEKELGGNVILQTSFGLLISVLVFGLITFRRLLERRVRAIEYLRAINRIHRFFVVRDSSINDYFYWSAYDDVPTFIERSTTLAGLRDMVACFNSLFLGVAVGETLRTTLTINYTVAFISGLAVALIALPLHIYYERWVLGGVEKKAAEFVKFPRAGSSV
jgi:hypothetical protein